MREPKVIRDSRPEGQKRAMRRKILHDADFRARLKAVHGYEVGVVGGKVIYESYRMDRDTTLPND